MMMLLQLYFRRAHKNAYPHTIRGNAESHAIILHVTRASACTHLIAHQRGKERELVSWNLMIHPEQFWELNNKAEYVYLTTLNTQTITVRQTNDSCTEILCSSRVHLFASPPLYSCCPVKAIIELQSSVPRHRPNSWRGRSWNLLLGWRRG